MSATSASRQAALIGVGVSASAKPGADPVALAQLAERVGFDFVSTADHPSGDQPTYEAWTILTWMAAATERIGIASRVLSVPFRSPALVAKMAESLDRLSGGRLILGLGAGAADDELRRFGLPVPSPRDKVDGLADALRILHGVWTEPDFTHSGRIHHTDSAVFEPKAERAIPIWLGTYGNRALTLTGQLADGWIPSLGYVSRAELVVMRARIRAAAEAAGRDPDAVRSVLNLEVALGGPDTGPDGDVIGGSAAVVVERLGELAQLGFRSVNVQLTGGDPHHNVEQFGAEVLPALRAALEASR
jgi:alkanesulfonate monooxygenase SsuD/methylene tetrahydromethanopterin reductase-like flavin-dependent oxidoreductase (luciferase family)